MKIKTAKREYVVYTGESQKNPDLIVGTFFVYLFGVRDYGYYLTVKPSS